MENVDSYIKRLKQQPIAFQLPESEVKYSDPKQLIPHRDPFLLIDRVTHVDIDNLSIEGERTLDPKDPIFKGHFENDPIYPGVLQIEMVAQLGLCFANYRGRDEFEGSPNDYEMQKGYFLKVHHALFIEASFPGDELIIKASIFDENPLTILVGGQVYSGDQMRSLCVVEAYINE